MGSKFRMKLPPEPVTPERALLEECDPVWIIELREVKAELDRLRALAGEGLIKVAE